eukprot:scaffold658_cov184-Alexandrium_tamarense.AAC.4
MSQPVHQETAMITQNHPRKPLAVALCLTSLILAPTSTLAFTPSSPITSHIFPSVQLQHHTNRSRRRPAPTTKRTALYDKSVMESTGEMILASDNNRLLDMAFSSLNDEDKYETVLTGLCAKVIDGGAGGASEGLVDPIRLMEEMNSSGIGARPRGVISLVDVSVVSLISFMHRIFFPLANLTVQLPPRPPH